METLRLNDLILTCLKIDATQLIQKKKLHSSQAKVDSLLARFSELPLPRHFKIFHPPSQFPASTHAGLGLIRSLCFHPLVDRPNDRPDGQTVFEGAKMNDMAEQRLLGDALTSGGRLIRHCEVPKEPQSIFGNVQRYRNPIDSLAHPAYSAYFRKLWDRKRSEGGSNRGHASALVLMPRAGKSCYCEICICRRN